MFRKRRRRLRAILFLAIGLIAAAASITAYAFDAFRQSELDTVDARFSIRDQQPASRDVAVVAIDDVTFGELQVRWPFPRSLHAGVIDRLRRAGARAIAYDVQFTEPSDPREDNALIEAVDRAQNMVLATTEVNERGEANVFGGEDVLRGIGARAGHALLPLDAGGVIRRMPHRVQGLDGLAVAATEAATAREVPRSALGGRSAWIDFHGPPGTLEQLSFSRVLRGRFDPEAVRGRIVVVGPSAPSLQDVHPTSASTDDPMAGAEIQASAVSTALRDFPLEDSPGWLDVTMIALLAFVAPLASLRLPALRAFALAIGAGVAYTVATQLAFNSGLVLSFVYPIGALALASVGVLAIHYLTEALERQRVREVFSRFVPESVVDEALRCADDDLRLAGVRRDATVMFSDLRGFTSFAESLPAEQVIGVLNIYLAQMSEAILDAGGTLVAYEGDGIMAVFGAPIAEERHADQALTAAREMLDMRLPRFNRWLRSEGLGEGFRMGIGLNSGSVMSGNVGSERRLEYTAIGDVTNTASRLEGMTKGTPYQVFVADSTRARLNDGAEALVFVDEMDVRGRQGQVKVWTLGKQQAQAVREP